MSRHVTLKQFRYFLAVAESNSVAAASRMLNIAQSAVTKSILELEATLGLVLFERSTRGMQLTPEGHHFLVKTRRVISAVADATRGVHQSVASLSGSITVGATSLVAGYYLSELFARFKRTCPGVALHVVEDEPPFLEHMLINGELDVGIMMSSTLAEPQALIVEELTRSPNRVWMAADHPLVNQEEVSLAECTMYGQVVLNADHIDLLIRRVWDTHKLQPRVALQSKSLEAVRSLVGVGAGVAVLPDFLYRPWTLDAERVEVRKLRDPVPTVDVGLVWRRGSQPRPQVIEFTEVARDQSRLRRLAP